MKALQTLGLSQREACGIVRARRRSPHEKLSTKAVEDAHWANRLTEVAQAHAEHGCRRLYDDYARDAMPDKDEFMNYKRFRRIYRLANLQIGRRRRRGRAKIVRGKPLRRATKPFEGWTLDFMQIMTGACLAFLLLSGCGQFGSVPWSPASSPATTRTASTNAGSDKGASYLYVANPGSLSGGEIDIFLRGDPSKGIIDRIRSGVFAPDGIFVDSHGNLYVTNGHMSGRESVEVYAKGGHKPIRFYTGALCAFDVIAASDGTVYIADACGGPHTRGRVLVYPPSRTKPSRSFFPGGTPYCLTLDAKNNLYVGYNSVGSYAGQVKRYRPGAKDGVDLIPPNTVHFLTSVAVDEHGALLVANEVGGAIDVFTGKDQPPSRVIKTGQSHPFMFALDRRENTIYVTNPCVGSPRPLTSSYCPPSGLPNTVAAIDYASGKQLWTLRVKVGWVPAGVAVEPTAPF